MQTVLILGAGRVSAPCVDYLVRKGNCDIVIADTSSENLAGISALFPSVKTVLADAAADAPRLVDEHSPAVLIYLLPGEYMQRISELCIAKKVHMVHPVYENKEAAALDGAIKAAGIVFVSELGLDPGIDHLSAAKAIDEIHARGWKVESFRSLCGALPALDANNNPWGYKLSWSPASLIGASKRTARLYQDGREICWPDGETYEHVYLADIAGFTFEVYANADSLPYREAYGIPEAETIYRGTLRYPGWCETICYMNQIRYFDTDVQDTKGMTFAQFSARQAGGAGDPKEVFCRRFGLKPWSAFMMKMEWLGFFADRPLPFDKGSARDVVSLLFGEKLLFTPQERDLVVLCDDITAIAPDGRKYLHRSLLVDYGVPGKWTSIARTTGVPPAIAAKFILDGTIKTPGLHKPTVPEIYNPVLEELAAEGIVLENSETEIK